VRIDSTERTTKNPTQILLSGLPAGSYALHVRVADADVQGTQFLRRVGIDLRIGGVSLLECFLFITQKKVFQKLAKNK